MSLSVLKYATVRKSYSFVTTITQEKNKQNLLLYASNKIHNCGIYNHWTNLYAPFTKLRNAQNTEDTAFWSTSWTR